MFLISPSRNAELCHIQLYTVSQPWLDVVSFALLHICVYLCRPFGIHTIWIHMFCQRHRGKLFRQRSDEIIMVSDSGQFTSVLQGLKTVYTYLYKHTYPCKTYTYLYIYKASQVRYVSYQSCQMYFSVSTQWLSEAQLSRKDSFCQIVAVESLTFLKRQCELITSKPHRSQQNNTGKLYSMWIPYVFSPHFT